MSRRPSREKLEEYRRMTPGERLDLTLKMSKQYQHCLFKGTPYQIKRRFERMRQFRDEGHRLMCEAFAREKRYSESRDKGLTSEPSES